MFANTIFLIELWKTYDISRHNNVSATGVCKTVIAQNAFGYSIYTGRVTISGNIAPK